MSVEAKFTYINEKKTETESARKASVERKKKILKGMRPPAPTLWLDLSMISTDFLLVLIS